LDYNVNADNSAAEIARALRAQKLVLLTNVRGIMTDMSDPKSLISHATESEIRDMIAKGIVKGGMIPKVNACLRALERGVKKTHIIDGSIPHGLLLEIYTDKGIGTEIERARWTAMR
jgi:acetylglutamate kinase